MKRKTKKPGRHHSLAGFHRPTYLGFPFLHVYLTWLIVSAVLTCAAIYGSNDPFSTFFTSLLVILFSNLVLLQGPDFDPTSKYSLNDGVVKKHSWFHKNPKEIALQDIATLQSHAWATAYVCKVQGADGKTVFRIPETKGTEELMKYLEKSLVKWQQQHRL